MRTHEELLAGLETKRFFSVPETARLFGCDERVIRKEIGNGTNPDFPATKLGCKWFVPTEWLRRQVRPACAA